MSVSKHFQPRTKRDLTVGSVRKLMYEHILHDQLMIGNTLLGPKTRLRNMNPALVLIIL